MSGYKSGEAALQSTVKATGAIAWCATSWSFTVTKPGFPPATMALGPFSEFRCDNAVSGKLPGCVVPWASAVLWFSASRAPALATHVLRAQASGLPGAVGAVPLHRTTNDATMTANRNRACGDSPSIAEFSCDEYPFASTAEGLSSVPDWRSWRRSFDGCLLPALVNKQTGAKGVSVCMVPVKNQNYQGGAISGFNKQWRELDTDPFFVGIMP